MRVRTAASLALVAVFAAGVHSPAEAKSKKHKKHKNLSKTYELTLTPAPVESPVDGTACDSTQRTEGTNLDIQSIKVYGPGKLKAEVSGFSGDWDMAVYTSAGSVAQGGGTQTPDGMSTPADPLSETVTYKSKKSQTLYLRVCNFAGTQDATVKYTYTYTYS